MKKKLSILKVIDILVIVIILSLIIIAILGFLPASIAGGIAGRVALIWIIWQGVLFVGKIIRKIAHRGEK
jgi:hypothetical protein